MCLWKWSHSVPSKLAISTIRVGNRCIEIDDILSLLNILSLPFQLYSPVLFCSMFWGSWPPWIVWTTLHCLSAFGWNDQWEEPKGDEEDREVGVFSLWFSLCVSLFEVTAPVGWPLLRTVSLQEPFYLLPVVTYPGMPHHPLWFLLTCSTFCEHSLYSAIFNHPFRVGCLFPVCHCF